MIKPKLQVLMHLAQEKKLNKIQSVIIGPSCIDSTNCSAEMRVDAICV